MMREDKLNELENLFRSVEMFEFADYAKEIIEDKNDLPEYVEYFQLLRSDAKQAMNTLSGNEFLKYRHEYETLAKILEIIYLFA